MQNVKAEACQLLFCADGLPASSSRSFTISDDLFVLQKCLSDGGSDHRFPQDVFSDHEKENVLREAVCRTANLSLNGTARWQVWT